MAMAPEEAQAAAGGPLAGVRTVSLSAPGVLTEETTPAQLEVSAAPRACIRLPAAAAGLGIRLRQRCLCV